MHGLKERRVDCILAFKGKLLHRTEPWFENFAYLLQYSVLEQKGCILNFLDYASEHWIKFLKDC